MINEDTYITAAKNGSRTVRYNNFWIHSRYSPEKEADAFASTLSDCESTRFFILIGDGLGYIGKALLKRYSEASLLTIPLFDKEVSPCFSTQKDERLFCWDGDDNKRLFSFIIGTIPEYAVHHLKIVHWLPAFKAAPQWSAEILKVVGEALSLLSANQATLRGFSEKWIRNSISNLLADRGDGNIFNMVPGCSAIVIAASGPGLDESIPVMREYRDKFLLCALPSSIEALYWSDLVPDIIINADAGYWARFHLTRLVKFGKREKKPFLFSSLSAGIPSESRSFSFTDYFSGIGFFIEQDSPFATASSPLLQLPARGTVAANALDICTSFTSGNIFLAGLDLAAHDLQFHVKPHSFDTIFHSMSDRYHPELGIRFQRALDAGFKGELSSKSDSSLDIYFRFFSASYFNERMFRISSSYSRSFSEDSAHPDMETIHFADLLRCSPSSGDVILNALPFSSLRSMLFSQLEIRIDRLLSMDKKDLLVLLQKSPRFRTPEDTILVHLAGLLDHDYTTEPKIFNTRALSLRERMRNVPKLYT
jgi:hypothetical protein